MGTLTEQQIKIREQIITEFANMGSMGECPYCHRTYLYCKKQTKEDKMKNKIYMTGYFCSQARPGNPSNVHITCEGKAICGAKFSKSSEFQWCSHGNYLKFVTCPKCIKISGRANF